MQWQPALVTLPPNALALRFVGTTGNAFRSDMALDAIGAGFPTVEFHELTCSFRFDTCLWYNNGAASWQLAVGEGSENGKWVEAGNSSHSYVLETAAMFNVTEEKMLLFGYQLLGSEFVALEVQHQTAAGDWQRLFLESASHAAVWHQAAVIIPVGTVGLRFVANLTSEVDVVRVDSLVLADLPGFLELSCPFRFDTCLWRNTGTASWQLAAGEGGEDGKWLAAAGNRSQALYILETPAVFNVTGEKMLIIGCQLLGTDSVALEVQHQISPGDWQSLFLESGPNTAVWHHAAVLVPVGTVSLRFIANLTSDLDVVRIDSARAEDVLRDWDDVACGFESDVCRWKTTSVPSFQRLSGATPSSGTGPETGSLFVRFCEDLFTGLHDKVSGRILVKHT